VICSTLSDLKRLFWIAPMLSCGLAFSQNGSLLITEPTPSKDGTIVTSSPAISLKGTVAWAGGDMRVLWNNDRGFSDLATVTLAADHKTVLWNSTSAIPLLPGINHVRVRALGPSGAASFVNIFYAPQTPITPPVFRTTFLHGKQITYEVRDGLAIYQSDMVLGKAADVAAGALNAHPATNSQSSVRPNSITIAPNFFSPGGLWPVVNGVARVPYTITNVSSANTNNINAAIAESNTQLAGVVQWEPANSSDANLVNFDFDPTNLSGACEANVGMIGGTQTIGGSVNCTTTTIMHEMGHALGLFHEQSRADRNTYVNYMEQNIDKSNHGNFDIIGSSSVDSGLYNYASIMEYGPFSFNKDGVSPTLETIPAGMVLGTTLPQYTTGDLDGIMRLYAHAPSAITVDTNPTGLQVIVDGTTCAAPCVFTNWTIGSEHTLSVPSANQTLQTLSGQNYIFGRWNAVMTGTLTAQSVTVTNSAGNGTLLSPTTSPAITNYLASFIPIHPYSPVVSQNDGAISTSPAPSSIIINGTPTNYYQDRQLVTFTVTPNSGYSFDFWGNVDLFNLYANPLTFYITSNFDSSLNGNPTTAVVVSDPVTTITASSPDTAATGLLPGIFPGFAIGVVDGSGNTSTAYTPVNFDASFNGAGFAAGKKVTFSTTAAQSPVTTNIGYQFSDWTGAGSPSGDSLSVTVPASGKSTSTANYTASFRSIVEPSLFCPNSSYDNELMVTSSPAGTNVNPQDTSDGDLDAFFTAGTVNFTAVTGATGLSFVGWSQDLASGGTTNPLSFALTGQVFGTANFNISGAAPLTIASVSPVTATSAAVNLTVTGTGFSTTASNLYTYYVDPSTGYYMYRSNTPTPAGSSTETIVTLDAGDVATAGYYQIVVLNAVTSGCNPSAVATFAVANSAGAPVLGITKSHVGNFNPGQQNAQYTVMVSNVGKGSIGDPVTVTENVPSGETLVSMSGSGWTCASGGYTCTRSDSLMPGMSYGAITVTVNVASNASSPQVNSVTVTGGGSASATATDSTTIDVAVPNVVGDTQSAAATAIQNAGLAVGTVTMMSSGTVPSGDVISESPAAGTFVSPGSAVNLVVSTGVTLKSIAVTPTSPAIVKGDKQQFTAIGTYSDGSTQNLTNSVTWVSGTTSVATINSTGLATGVAAGTSNTTASMSGVTSPADELTVASLSSSATYAGLDAATQGLWTGKYGANGYLIANDTTSPPSYATVSLTGDSTYTWAGASSANCPRGLQVSSGSANCIGSAYYSSSSFSINVNLTDGNTHRVSLYLVDWDSTARAETISILDAASNEVLDTQSFANFHNGAYAVWNIQGHVLIQVTKTAGNNAVVAGIFFDAAPPSAATYSGLDTTTQGTWTGKYGADGKVIANDLSALPAYATASLTGDTVYTWAAASSANCPRALQVSSGSANCIASTYYSGSSFTINLNLLDGNAHRIALYLLDWDSTARAESISVLDATSNAVLNTQTFSSFHNGEYAVWNVQGHVLIQVTRTGGSNGVVAGIFFDTAPTSATYSGLDTTTQGTWTGKYGSNGEIVANGANTTPGLATVSLTDDTAYTWAASTTDVRALQTSSGASSRIASAFYSSSSFVVNLNLTDGNVHKISLYLLDWDGSARSETVSVVDAENNAVLNTQSFSSFHNGEYAVWNVQGHVLIQVTRTGGSNAVVSGIFVD